MEERRSYDKAYKIKAAKLAIKVGSVKKAAKTLGISPKTLSPWTLKYKRGEYDSTRPADTQDDCENMTEQTTAGQTAKQAAADRDATMIEHLDVIEALHKQISALIDLMQSADINIDVESINTAAEMCQTMLDEMMEEIKKIEDDWREQK